MGEGRDSKKRERVKQGGGKWRGMSPGDGKELLMKIKWEITHFNPKQQPIIRHELTATLLSPSSLPCLNLCCSSSGSRAASKVSPIFSSNTQRPNRTPFSSVRKKFLSLIFTTSKSFVQIVQSLPIIFMYLLACPWGSINNGYLRPFSIIIPFSTEWESDGRPHNVQFLWFVCAV